MLVRTDTYAGKDVLKGRKSFFFCNINSVIITSARTAQTGWPGNKRIIVGSSYKWDFDALVECANELKHIYMLYVFLCVVYELYVCSCVFLPGCGDFIFLLFELACCG